MALQPTDPPLDLDSNSTEQPQLLKVESESTNDERVGGGQERVGTEDALPRVDTALSAEKATFLESVPVPAASFAGGAAGGAAGGGQPNEVKLEGKGSAENVLDSSSSSLPIPQDPSLPSSDISLVVPSTSQFSTTNDPPPTSSESPPAAAGPLPPLASAPTSYSFASAPIPPSLLPPSSTDSSSVIPAAASKSTPSGPPSVVAPSPVPSPSLLPPPTSSSTPPPISTSLHFTHPIKKFTAVSVNKRFLSNTNSTPASSSSSSSTATSSTPSTLKSSLSTSSTTKVPPIQPSHPPSRLLTTKLVHPTPRVAAPSPAHAGWARPTPSPGAVPSSSSLKPDLGGPGVPSLFRSRGGDSFSWGPGPGGERRGAGGGGGLRSQFPTTAESAEEGRVNAQAAKQAAAAKSQAVLLELDAFRGVHLDPNAHHWDDVDDEDDDFLDDVVEFGDGTQYTIDHTQPAPEVEEEKVEEKEQQQRYPPANDFDRSWPQKQGGGPPSQHPHPPSSRAPPPHHHQQSNYRPSSSPSSEHYLHHGPPSQAQPHLARPPPTSAHLPSKPRAGEDPSRVLFNARSNQFEPPSSGRSGVPPQGPSGGLGVGGGPGGRRPSNDRQPTRGFDRPPPPHVELQRSLPPHLDQGRGGPPPPSAAAIAPVPQAAPPPSKPAWGLARDRGGVGLGGLSSPPAASNKDFPPPSSALSTNRPALPPQSNVFATSAAPSLPPPNSRSARVSFSTPTPVARLPSSVGSPETALHHLPHPSLALRRTSTEHGGGLTPTQVVEDVSAMQKDEMHSAADRAKLRRQKEEEERQAAIERAKAKAKALEERFAPKVEVVEVLKKEEDKKEVILVVASSPAPVPTPVAAFSTPAPTPPTPTKAPAPAPSSSAFSSQGTPARSAPVEKWKLNGNLLPSAGMDTPPPPRILKGGPIPDDVQVIDFANLGSLVASQTQASSSRVQTPQPSPTKSRRPVATDFFDHPPPSPSKPSSTPFSSLPVKVESSSINTTSLPPRPPPTTEATSSSSPSPFAQSPTPSPTPPSSLPPAMEVRSSSKGPPSPTKQAHHPVELSSFDDAMARIRGAMVPRSSTSPTPTNGLSAPPSPTKSSTPRPLPPPEPESDQTKPDRPTSPVLAWKVYPVRLPSSSAVRRPLVDSKQAKLYNRADAMIKVVDPVSWEPPLWKTPLGKAAAAGGKKDASRDEMLHSGAGAGNGGRKVSAGKVAGPAVFLPTRRGWERLKMRAEVKAEREAKAAASTPSTPLPSPPPPSAAPTPKPTLLTPSPTPLTSQQLSSNPTVLPPTLTTSTSLPSRPGVVPSLSVIPPTPLRPLKPSRAMEESSWRRRAPLPEIVVAEQEKEGEKEEGVESIAIGETTEGGTVVLNRSLKGVEVRIQARVKVEEVEKAVEERVVVVEEKKVEVKKVEEKQSSPLPTFEVQQPPQQPAIDLSSPISESGPSKSSSLKLPEGADVGFYRDRSPSIGTVSQEQLEPLVRFMVTSEIDTFHAEELGPKSTDPGVEEDGGPEFASIMRSPSSSGGDLTRTESSNSIPRLPTNMSGVVLSPPSAATSSAWSKSVPKVDREQHVRDVWAQSSSSSSSPNDLSRNVGGPFPSSLHFSSPDPHSQGGHQNNNGSIRSFAGGPHSNNNVRGQFPPPQQQQQRNFVGGQQQQAQGFPSPYNTPLSRPNGGSQPNSPGMYQSSFNAGSPRPNPSAPTFPNPQLGRTPPSLNQAAPHRPSFSAYPSSLSISSSGSSQGHPQHQPGGGGGGSMMYSSQQPTLNPTSQPFMMRPGAGGVPIITSPSPLVGISGLPPPPFAPTTQGVWLPVVPVPPLRPNPQQQHGGSYSGLPSPSPVFSSPSLHQPSPYSSHNSLPSPNPNNHNLNHFNSSPNLAHHAPTYRNLSDFSSSPNSPSIMGGFGGGAGGRQAPPHQPQNQHGMFSSNGRGGPMDNHARGGSNTSSNSNSNSNANANAQPIYASIGSSTPQGGGGSYGSGYAGGAGGGGRRW